MEGLYLCQWDTYVLAHINPDSVDKTFRDAEAAAAFEQSVRTGGEAFCTGIVTAPVTKKRVIPVYAPVYNDAHEAIAIAGAAFMTDELSEILDKITDTDSTNMEYSLLDAETCQYIFDDDPSLVGLICEYPNVHEAAAILRSNGGVTDTRSYVNDTNVVSCYMMREHDWMFVVAEKKASVFGLVNTMRSVLLGICSAITAIMVIVCALSVNRQMKPIETLQKQIVRLKSNDFTIDSLLGKYAAREDEIGTIASAVQDLHVVLENQYELFREIIEGQTVGTLVVNTVDNKVMLLNNTALKGFGSIKKSDEITVEDILAIFDDEQRQKIEEFRRLVMESEEELSFEAAFTSADGTRISILIRAKKVTLSSKCEVIIFSIMDISDRKKLEEELLVLSETDFLTSVCNRRSGEYRIENMVKSGKFGMFCLFDANKFKYVNDNFGHAVGDKVLIAIAQTMQKTFRTSDVLIRLGGDEFVVFVSGVTDTETGKSVLNRFMGNIEKIDIEELGGHKITVSLGALIVNDENEDFSKMYTKADSLMYECKRRGGNTYIFYDNDAAKEA